MISRSNVTATVILNIFLPDSDGMKIYKRKAEFITEVNDENGAAELFNKILKIVKREGFQIIACEIID